MGKPQPPVSRTLSQLEARIGAPLIQPGRRPLQPTELGLSLADQGRTVLRANRNASEIVTRFRTGHAGLVRVGGTPIFMDCVVAGMIAAFQQQMQNVRVDQSYGYAYALMERLLNGTLDVAILPMQKTTIPEGLIFRPMLAGLNVIACRADHPLARRKVITPEEIDRYRWIAPPPPADSPLYKDLRRALANIGAESFRGSFPGSSLASVFGGTRRIGHADRAAPFGRVPDPGAERHRRVVARNRPSGTGARVADCAQPRSFARRAPVHNLPERETGGAVAYDHPAKDRPTVAITGDARAGNRAHIGGNRSGTRVGNPAGTRDCRCFSCGFPVTLRREAGVS